MKILMFGWEFPPIISGGLAVACHGLTKGLNNLGHKVTFVLPVIKDGADKSQTHVSLIGSNQIDISEIPDPEQFSSTETLQFKTVDALLHPYINELEYIESLKMLRSISTLNKTPEKGNNNSYDFNISGDYGPNLMEEVYRYSLIAGAIALKVEHDVIHAHDWLTALAGVQAKRISGKPLILHIHALEFDRCGENVNQAVYDIEKSTMSQADRVIAVSHYTKNMITTRYGIPEDKVTVVHNAVDKATFPAGLKNEKKIKEKVILFLGRITFQKGPEYFVEAAARVLKVRKDVKFVMAGSGDMTPRMIELAARHKIGRYFHFTGFLRGEAVERMYAQSDIYIMPSVSEPFGISPLEAMRYDVPVIVSKQSGVAEILDNALKVDFWDIDEIANKILAILNHEPLRQEIVARSSQDIQRFQWDSAAQNVVNLYQQVIA